MAKDYDQKQYQGHLPKPTEKPCEEERVVNKPYEKPTQSEKRISERSKEIGK